MLRLLDLQYKYKGEPRPALDGFTAELSEGMVTALLGPNGAGKSTALGIAAGWRKPGSGRLERDGAAAFLPQMERLAFAFSCLEYVSFGRAPHLPYLGVPGGEDREIAADALRKVGMIEKRDKPITALSGGELQLVRLARALAQEAAWTVLDEPSDMLDPGHVAQVSAVLRGIAESGDGVVLSTHDLGFALAVADRAVLVKDGRALAAGPCAELITPEAMGELYGQRFGWARLPWPTH